MKKYFLFFMALSFLLACKIEEKKVTPVNGLQQMQPPQELLDSANFTTVQWLDSTFIDAGKVKKGQVAEITFRLKNTGDKPLIISTVRPGCGCTLAEKPEQAIAPGKEGKIVAKFNSENQSTGPHSKSIFVEANTKPMTQHSLIFSVNVVD